MSVDDPVNILLVDDQPAKLLSYEAILGELGETLIKAESGREALAQLLKHDVAAVLIDVQMPELDGFELAGMIREHPRFQQTPLIFVSAIHLSELDRIKGYEAGAVDYVPVPVVPEVLRGKVRVFVDLYRKTRELERLNAELEQRVADRTAALEESSRALRQLNEQLERRITERTREREQALAQLFEAQKIDTIGQLTGGVAHDFNNLLMAVLGNLEILRKRVRDDSTSLRLLENAQKGAERGAALTQRLLAFARRQELRPEAVKVQPLMEGMRDLLARSLGPGVRLVEVLPADLAPVLVDENQLELAILNLSVNARDAMVDGAGTICISGEPYFVGDKMLGLPPGPYVRISVSDDGQGMDEETLARATEPFFTTKGIGKGTGLGLSMVHGLVAQSGGALRLSSRKGEGSRVDIWLPQALESSDITEESASPPSIELACASRTVLVVDDDALVSAGTAAMLEDLGHSVIEANSAADALIILESGCTIDLVITDHAMPTMTGLELAQKVRHSRPDLPLVLATGYADLPDTEPLGAALPRLSKPFRQDELARIISQYTLLS